MSVKYHAAERRLSLEKNGCETRNIFFPRDSVPFDSSPENAALEQVIVVERAGYVFLTFSSPWGPDNYPAATLLIVNFEGNIPDTNMAYKVLEQRLFCNIEITYIAENEIKVTAPATRDPVIAPELDTNYTVQSAIEKSL